MPPAAAGTQTVRVLSTPPSASVTVRPSAKVVPAREDPGQPERVMTLPFQPSPKESCIATAKMSPSQSSSVQRVAVLW